MSKLDAALAAIPKRQKGPACSIAALLSQLESDERAALETALTSTSEARPTGKALAIAIASAYGVEVHRASVERHRRGDCLCSRVTK